VQRVASLLEHFGNQPVSVLVLASEGQQQWVDDEQWLQKVL